MLTLYLGICTVVRHVHKVLWCSVHEHYSFANKKETVVPF